MRVEFETNKKEATAIASFLFNYFVSAFCKNWRSYKLMIQQQITYKDC